MSRENVVVFPGLERVYRGHDGVLKWDRDAFDAWEWFRTDVLEVNDAGDDVVAFVRGAGKGSSSGVEVEIRVYVVYAVRDAKIARRRVYTDRAQALEAAGLSE